MQEAIIFFENKTYFKCKSFGANGTRVAEVVFNTSLSGYQEIISDPSYAGQFVNFCMPEIGNVGANEDDMESKGVFAKGVIVHSYNEKYFNFRAEESLASFLKRYDTLGICDLDTREITSMIRKEGTLKAVISTQEFDLCKLNDLIKSSPSISDINFSEVVSTKQKYLHNQGVWDSIQHSYNKSPSKTKKIVAIDFGVKKNILNELSQSGLSVEVSPWNFDEKEIISRFDSQDIGGVFLSNGPGDPMILKPLIVSKIQALISHNIPIFAICFGHQLLSIAHNFDTIKLKFGHHGGNHPVIDDKGKVQITAQNHIYNVPEEITKSANVTSRNLFDNTIEALKYKDKQVFSVQYHPESSPGPQDSKNYFTIFAKMVKQTTS